jgi:NADH dehydrogenase
VPIDVTRGESLRETLAQAFENGDAVVSLVGILQDSPTQFEAIQKGAENVARVAAVGAKLVHISAIGEDPHSTISYASLARTKALGEEAVRFHFHYHSAEFGVQPW